MTIKLNRAVLVALFTAASTTALTANAHEGHTKAAEAMAAAAAAKTEAPKPDCCKNMDKDAPCMKMMQGHGGHEGHSMGMSKPQPGDTASTRELKEANIAMHKDMDIAYTGDVDVDFLRGMIAHHQGAVEMASIQLKYGKDAQVKRISQDIIRSQNIEIRWMKSWLAQLEKRKLSTSDTPKASGAWTDETWTGNDDIWFHAR